jgi:hypothetical protein
MTWSIYLSGEIHTDWRDQIEDGALTSAGLDCFSLSGPVPRPPQFALQRNVYVVRSTAESH